MSTQDPALQPSQAADLARAQETFDRAVMHWLRVLHGQDGLPQLRESRLGPPGQSVRRLIRQAVEHAATSAEANGDIGWVLADIVEFAHRFGLSTQCIDEAYEDPC